MNARTLAAVFAVFFIVASVQAKPILLAAMDYPPHYGESLKQNGPLIELVVTAYQQQDYQVEIVFLPWIRALEWSKQGRVDGVIGIWHSQEREAFLLYSNPIYPNEMFFYQRTGRELTFSTYADLVKQNLTLGSTRGYQQVKGLEESGIKINYVNNDIQNFKLLVKGRIDLLVADKAYANYILASPELKSIAPRVQPIDQVLEQRQQFLAISKLTANPRTKLTEFNLGLSKLKSNGEFQAILAKHGLD